MADMSVEKQRASFPIQAVYKKPFLGLLAVFVLLAWQAFGHTLTVLLREVLDRHSTIYYAYFLFGATGLYCVWKGFGKDELTATCLGALGGGLIWFGWFEATFELLADIMKVPPIMDTNPVTGKEYVYYGGGIQLLEMTGVLILPVLFMLGLNKDTRCRLFKWFHRNLKVKPETPTVGYRRQYSRITALEYIFVTWFIYFVCLLMLDKRLFAVGGPVMSGLFLLYCCWAAYLFYKVTQQSGPAPTIRYSMAAGIVIWLVPETLSAMQVITEIWLKPFDYPITMGLMTLFMIAGAWILYLAPDRGAAAKKKPKAKTAPANAAAAPAE